MKKLVTTLLFGTLVTSCNFDSDPTKGTKYNYKNTVPKSQLTAPEAPQNIKQKSSHECKKYFSNDIDKTYFFEPGQTTSETLVAYSNLSDVHTTLKIIPNEKKPKGLNLNPVANKKGEYQFHWNTAAIKTRKNYEVFYVDLELVATNKTSLNLLECEVSSKKTVKLIYVDETQKIPVKVDQKDLSAEGIIELNHDLNATNTFTVSLPNKSGITIYPLPKSVDSLDIADYTSVTHSKAGLFTVTIDVETLAEKFKGQDEQELALAMTATADNAYAEDFQIHFKFISNIKTDEPTSDTSLSAKSTDGSQPEGK